MPVCVHILYPWEVPPSGCRGERILIRGMTRSNVCFRKVPEGAEWGGRRPVRGWGSPAAQAIGQWPKPRQQAGEEGGNGWQAVERATWLLWG